MSSWEHREVEVPRKVTGNKSPGIFEAAVRTSKFELYVSGNNESRDFKGSVTSGLKVSGRRLRLEEAGQWFWTSWPYSAHRQHSLKELSCRIKHVRLEHC